jgi:dihydroflavonol-4-reductase
MEGRMATRGVVLVTGGSGYIAGFCILQLLAEGWSVRTTIRDLKKASQVRAALGVGEELAVLAADLTADAGWDEAVKGADYVLHVASPLPVTTPRTDDELIIPARDGALRVLRAARAAGVKRVVMTSSTASVSYGRGSRDKPDTEEIWSDASNLADTSPYVRSKIAAERAAWAFVEAEGGLQLTTVLPSAVLGPVLGSDFSASIEIVRKLMDGSFGGLPRLGWPVVDARDIADLHVRAMTHPEAAGQRFLGAGEFLWVRDVARILKAGLPKEARKVPTMAIPDFAVRLAALFDKAVASVTFELGKARPVSAAKAGQVMGWKARPAEQTVVDCAKSLVDHGLV